MKQFLRSHHPIRHAKSFKYAFSGIFHALLNEANFRVQVAIVSICGILAIHFKISNVEWAVLILAMGSLLSAELVNTVVEEFMDNLFHEHHEGVRVIKDVSAGFVLITAITAFVIMMLVFWHRLV